MINPDDKIHPDLSRSYNSDSGEREYWFSGGLTIRAHFAAMMAQAFIPTVTGEAPFRDKMKSVAEVSVEMADALIAALNK